MLTVPRNGLGLILFILRNWRGRGANPFFVDGSLVVAGQVDLAELDGPFVKLRLKGKFWHTRATVVARIGNYLKNRIPVRVSSVLECLFLLLQRIMWVWSGAGNGVSVYYCVAGGDQ